MRRVRKSRVVTAQCVCGGVWGGGGCQCRIHASRLPDGITYKIISLCGDNTCVRTVRNAEATSTYINLDSNKGSFGTVLLATVALDVNNGLYPLDYGIVESEGKNSWSFFLYYVHSIIDGSQRFEKSTEWKSLVTPLARKKLDEVVLQVRILLGISGIPCKHAVAACIAHKRMNVKDYCDTYYKRHVYFRAYGGIIHPIHDESLWDEVLGDLIQPPPFKRKNGRALLLELMTLEGPALSSVVTVDILAITRGLVKGQPWEIPMEAGVINQGKGRGGRGRGRSETGQSGGEVIVTTEGVECRMSTPASGACFE
ncbi:hypothetical protein Acr_11g0017400 [Actinidia rufa]|uniref:Uncharacterized protein n=1 Tax=Actinidia rufa TaxID=165716 RepID=A0A7J0FFG2_9ERIC|nr:hypothetical protein Acr_11g0017400 [Actinidia rufa]